MMRTRNINPGNGSPRAMAVERSLRVWRWLAPAIAILTILHIPALQAQQPKVSEYQVKAAYLYNFGKFVKWPESMADKSKFFAVCVLGQDPFGSTLDSIMAGEELEGKHLVVKRISAAQEADDCRILFISANEESHLKEILQTIDESGVLTVSDIPSFSRRGGMIEFVIDGDKVRFEINLAKAEASRLTLSSQLLKVATAVRTNGSPGGP